MGGVLVPGRVLAGHLHWGVPGGLVVVTVYLHVEREKIAETLGLVWAAVTYVK